MINKKFFGYTVPVLILAVVLIYICSIFCINFSGRCYVNYDMYSDAILAKYIAEGKTLFPEGWHFGNQVYTVATPVLASVFYLLFNDSYSALALASCCMTVLCVLSFIWFIKPFAKPRSVLLALLVLIGGTNIGYTAHGYIEGLQLFYTMASYYSCYVIGIFLTLGVYCRYINSIHINKNLVFGVLLLNFALGMQSLREILVLNLPLCAVALIDVLLGLKKKTTYKSPPYSHFYFAFGALFAGMAGVLMTLLLKTNGTIKQSDVLRTVSSELWDNIVSSINALFSYIGLVAPVDSFSTFRLIGALFSITIVITAIISVSSECLKHKITPTAIYIFFFTISLSAVFVAGVFFIELRAVYYFCWYLLVSVCVVHFIEVKWRKYKKLLRYLKNLLAIGLLCISFVNYTYTFAVSFKNIYETKLFYHNIVEQLNADGIRFLYSDWRTEYNMIATMSNDEIVYSTLLFSNNPEDLWIQLDYLYMDSWFDDENFDDAYIILTTSSLLALETEFSPEYKNAFMSNLKLMHEFTGNNTNVYLYKGTEKMYNDMVNSNS